MSSFLHKTFKWNIQDLLKCTLGVILFAFSMNFFIEPNNLYSGGVFGLAQLLNQLVGHLFHIGNIY